MRPIPMLLPLLLVLLLAPASAHEPPGQKRRADALRDVASRIVGGASLLVELDPRRATRDLHDRAHRFEDGLGSRRDGGELRADWQRLRGAFEEARRTGGRPDERRAFLFVHLAEELEAGDALVGRVPSSAPDTSERRKYAFVLTEECVGTNRAGARPCPSPRRELSFRIPQRISAIHRIVGEWRDYGRDTRPQVLVNGQVVWKASAKSGWDTDGKSLTLPVRPGSVLSLRSTNGDPFWVRRLEVEYDETPGR